MKTIYVAEHATVVERMAKRREHYQVRTKKKDKLRSLGTFDNLDKAVEVAEEFSRLYDPRSVYTLIADYTGEVIEKPDCLKALNTTACHLIIRKAEEHIAYMANNEVPHDRETDLSVTIDDMEVIVQYAEDLLKMNRQK